MAIRNSRPRARRRGIPCLPCAKAAQCAQRSKYPWGASPRRFTTALIASLRRGGRLCPPKHRVAVSFRASDRCHWRGNPPPFHVNSGQRPPPIFAAPRQRRDSIIVKTLGGVSKGEGRSPPSLVVSRMGDFQGGRKIETSFPLEWRSLVTFFRQGKKVTLRRQNKKQKSLISPQKNNGALAPLFFVHFRGLTPRPRPHQRGSAARGWTGRSSASPRRWP